MSRNAPKRRKLRWESSPRKIPAHPYRDSAVVYGVLCAICIGVVALTGGNMRNALIIFPLLFVVGTGYSWWRWHEREKAAAREEQQ